MERLLVIVTGCPGSGKSTFAARLCRRYPTLTLLSYDGVKEEFFDRYGFASLEERDALNVRSLAEFYRRMDEQMDKGCPLLIEYPFCRKHRPALEQQLLRHDYRAVTLLLTGELPVLYARWVGRDQHMGRHLGHLVDAYHKGMSAPVLPPQPTMTLEQFGAMCREKDYNIALGETISVDVTDLHAPDYGPAFARLDQLLGADGALRRNEAQQCE